MSSLHGSYKVPNTKEEKKGETLVEEIDKKETFIKTLKTDFNKMNAKINTLMKKFTEVDEVKMAVSKKIEEIKMSVTEPVKKSEEHLTTLSGQMMKRCLEWEQLHQYFLNRFPNPGM